jgi:hypothetical protein
VIPVRESAAELPNDRLKAHDAHAREGNSAWFKRCPVQAGIVLIGGSSLVDFRLRYAQSELRSDLSPSYWSLCGLIDERGLIRTAPLQLDDVSTVPVRNAVRTLAIDQFDDPELWPNVAVLSFVEQHAVVAAHADRVARRRTIVDLPPLVLDWLAYAWAVNEGINPLNTGRGMPSAAFVHAAHSLAGIELTPGLASTAACPEAIWQAVKWWHEYYSGVVEIGAASEVTPIVPRGYYALRQRSAAVRLGPDAPLFDLGPAPGAGAAVPPSKRRKRT